MLMGMFPFCWPKSPVTKRNKVVSEPHKATAKPINRRPGLAAVVTANKSAPPELKNVPTIASTISVDAAVGALVTMGAVVSGRGTDFFASGTERGLRDCSGT